MKKLLNSIFLVFTATYLCAFMASKPVKTIENLKVAYQDEMTASAKYTAYAQKATKEGFTSISKLFSAAAKAESIHAANHVKALEKLGEKPDPFTPKFTIKSTKENLTDAINGENYEKTKMYPGFITIAKQEQVNAAVTSFTWALDTEKKHFDYYQSTLNLLTTSNIKKVPSVYYICPKCGNTFDATALPAECDFCSRKQDTFIKI